MILGKNKLLYLFVFINLFCSCKRELITIRKPIDNVDQMMPDVKIFPVNNIIEFSGYKWIVSNSPDKKAAPGNNYWSSNSVWVDGSGNLHLRLQKDPESEKWFCAEVKSEKEFGFGLYKFWIEGSLDQLDKNVVLGLFNYSGVDFFDEIDIEFSRWGNQNNKNLHYTVYPEENSSAKTWGVSSEITLNDEFSLHQFTRSKTSVKFESYYDFESGKTQGKTYNSATVSKKDMPIYINLWSFQNKSPSDNKEVEIIIQKFEFIK